MWKVAGEHPFCVLIYMNSYLFQFYFIELIFLSNTYLIFDFICFTLSLADTYDLAQHNRALCLFQAVAFPLPSVVINQVWSQGLSIALQKRPVVCSHCATIAPVYPCSFLPVCSRFATISLVYLCSFPVTSSSALTAALASADPALLVPFGDYSSAGDCSAGTKTLCFAFVITLCCIVFPSP